MSYSPDYAAGTLRVERFVGLLVGLGLVVFSIGWARTAQATNVRVRSTTVGQATHLFRTDGTVEAPRRFTQSMSLWGYDLLDDQTGSANAHVSFRYHTDFSLESNRRNDPHYSHRWNELWLDLAYVDWRPIDHMRLRAGRQWAIGSLGPRDFDGLAWRWQPEIDRGTRAHFELYGGRDVQTPYGRFDPATYDVQGLPAVSDDDRFGLDGTHLLAGAAAGLRFERTSSLQVNWRRRFSVGVSDPNVDDGTVVGSERIGAAGSTSIGRNLVASTHASYHAQLGDFDRAGLQFSWAPDFHRGTLTAGADHRRPWFDSSSIFNVFGAQPYRGGFATYRYPVDALRTDFEVRGWGRHYRGDDAATASGVDAQSERTVGSALAHDTRVDMFGRTADWRSLTSLQTSLDRRSNQLLADVRLRMPLFERDLFISARALGLGVLGDHHRRDDDGFATTGVLGLDVPVGSVGMVSAAVETTGGTFYPTHTNAYATFTLDHWP
ncbi:MAG: hypothetical protein ACOCV2_10455 [Persicimonas sp.]